MTVEGVWYLRPGWQRHADEDLRSFHRDETNVDSKIVKNRWTNSRHNREQRYE